MSLRKSMKTSSMVEKSLNKSFQTSYTFFSGAAPNIRLQMMLFTLNLSLEIRTLAPLVRKLLLGCD